MFELLRSCSRRELYGRYLPGLAIAFVVADLFYKWGSFALECLGFMATWFLLDLIFGLAAGRLRRNGTDVTADNAE